jgi:hypothetical protein
MQDFQTTVPSDHYPMAFKKRIAFHTPQCPEVFPLIDTICLKYWVKIGGFFSPLMNQEVLSLHHSDQQPETSSLHALEMLGWPAKNLSSHQVEILAFHRAFLLSEASLQDRLTALARIIFGSNFCTLALGFSPSHTLNKRSGLCPKPLTAQRLAASQTEAVTIKLTSLERPVLLITSFLEIARSFTSKLSSKCLFIFHLPQSKVFRMTEKKTPLTLACEARRI